MTLSASNKKNKLKTGRYNLIFYSLMMIWPLLQFFVFYVLVKFNSVLYAFQDYDLLTDKTVWTFDNMRNAFSMMTQRPLFRSMMSMSLLTWVIGLAIGTPLALIFSYYIYKALPASGFFRVRLFSAVGDFRDRHDDDLSVLRRARSARDRAGDDGHKNAGVDGQSRHSLFRGHVLQHLGEFRGIRTDVLGRYEPHFDGGGGIGCISTAPRVYGSFGILPFPWCIPRFPPFSLRAWRGSF